MTTPSFIARCASCGAQDWGPKLGTKGQTWHCLPCAQRRVVITVNTPRVRLINSPIPEPAQSSLFDPPAPNPYDQD